MSVHIPISHGNTAATKGINVLNYEKVVANIVLTCTEAGKTIAQKNAMAGCIEAMYLYYKASTATKNGDVIFVLDSDTPPPGYMLVTGEGLRGHIPYDAYYQWVNSRVSRLPILAWND